MRITCVWEHNGDYSLLYSSNFIGAFARGENLDIAINKMVPEIISYIKWKGEPIPDSFDISILQEQSSSLNIGDADSDVIFDEERRPVTAEEYNKLKLLTLKSADDFLSLFNSIQDKYKGIAPVRNTFYGKVPRTATEMYEHAKNVNSYYFGEIGVNAGNEGNILECRQRGFELLESHPDFLNICIFDGSYGEEWSLRKVIRRFLWHDRIHAKAMYKRAKAAFGANSVPDIFCFD